MLRMSKNAQRSYRYPDIMIQLFIIIETKSLFVFAPFDDGNDDDDCDMCYRYVSSALKMQSCRRNILGGYDRTHYGAISLVY